MMTENEMQAAAAQTYLASQGFYRASVDGDWGPKSSAAAGAWYAASSTAIVARMPTIYRDRARGKVSQPTLRRLAAQIYLADGGYYAGEIDADWGPLSRDAARRWNLRTRYPNGLTPYDVALNYLGVREIPGKENNTIITNWYRRLKVAIYDDETPWCSTFVNFCALEAGYERTGKLNARSWLDCGREVELSAARQGDVLIFERGTSGWEGHVTFLHTLDKTRQTASCLGGNQSDSVCLSNYSLAKLLGIRRLRSLDILQGSTSKV